MKLKAVIMGLVALIGFFGMSMTLDKVDVPEVVKNAFAQKFPDAKKVEWEMEEANEYEAEFKQNGVEVSANFQEDGTWLQTETEIKKKDLPQAIKDAIATNFADYELEEAEQLETPERPFAYEVELENEIDDTEIKAVFAPDGTLLKQHAAGEDDDNEGDEDDQ